MQVPDDPIPVGPADDVLWQFVLRLQRAGYISGAELTADRIELNPTDRGRRLLSLLLSLNRDLDGLSDADVRNLLAWAKTAPNIPPMDWNQIHG